MIKYLKVVCIAIIIGGLFAYFFYKDIKNEVDAIGNSNDTLYLFQTGVFKKESNALAFKEEFTSNEVVYDGEYYRVYIGVTSNLENKDKLKNYYNSLGINYFIKEVSLDEELAHELNNYEILLSESDRNEVIDRVNQKMLDIFFQYTNIN